MSPQRPPRWLRLFRIPKTFSHSFMKPQPMSESSQEFSSCIRQPSSFKLYQAFIKQGLTYQAVKLLLRTAIVKIEARPCSLVVVKPVLGVLSPSRLTRVARLQSEIVKGSAPPPRLSRCCPLLSPSFSRSSLLAHS
ncbi:hypothetical protein B0H12DRAFT_1326375 [Mycena haematopus]|nr:hypothetical protein B0H12DRAFT_1326375 [Mycena haematopus]